MSNPLKKSKMSELNKKLRQIGKKFNWIVRKINGQQQQQPQQQATTITTAMPAMSKEKTSAVVSINESDFNELNVKELMTTTTNTTTNTEIDATEMATTVTVTAMAPTTSSPIITALQQQPQQQIQQTQLSQQRQQQQQQQQQLQQQQRDLSNGVCGCGNASATNTTTSLNRNKPTTQNGQTSSRVDAMTQQQSSHSTCCRGARSKSQGRDTTSTAATTTTACSGSRTPPMRRSAEDYVFGRYIGEGSFSSVYLAQDIYTKRDYAIKVCDKRHILREQKQEYVRREREIMHLMTNVPGFVNLSCTFQDHRSLYFVMTFAQNGDMLPHINKVGSFDVECTRHYAAEIVLACEQMHRRNIVHRDLKPENILLDEEMHTLIADFGSAKLLKSNVADVAVPTNAAVPDILISTTLSSSECSSSPKEQQPASSESNHADEQEQKTDNNDTVDDASAKEHNVASNEHQKSAESASGDDDDDDNDDDDVNDNDDEDNNDDDACAADDKDNDNDNNAGNENGGIPRRVPRYRRKRKASFVGTAQYVSPEVLQNKTVTPAADLWALGCIIYQMISGLPPFRGSNDYVIFKEILACELDFPPGFDADAEDLVRKLVKINPKDRLGALDDFSEGIYTSIRTHPFFSGIDFDLVRDNEPPKIYPYLPIEELRSKYSVPDNLKPGLDKQQLTRLIGMELGTVYEIIVNNKPSQDGFGMNYYEKRERLEKQKSDKWHPFAENEVIFKKGFVNKRKGLFARKRMLLLTSGPRLIYIDPVQMVKKGEIPWSPELRVEPKNFKIFFVHTPNRTYYLEDPEGYALEWVDAIERMRKYVYRDIIDPAELTIATTPNTYANTASTQAVMTTATSYLHTTRSTPSSSSSRQNSKLISS